MKQRSKVKQRQGISTYLLMLDSPSSALSLLVCNIGKHQRLSPYISTEISSGDDSKSWKPSQLIPCSSLPMSSKTLSTTVHCCHPGFQESFLRAQEVTKAIKKKRQKAVCVLQYKLRKGQGFGLIFTNFLSTSTTVAHHRHLKMAGCSNNTLRRLKQGTMSFRTAYARA